MAYDEKLAERIRGALGDRHGLDERRMFGGLAFVLHGHTFAGVIGTRLMARVGPEGAEQALKQRHTAPMDFTGRPLKGYIYVSPAGVKDGRDLRRWLTRAATPRNPGQITPANGCGTRKRRASRSGHSFEHPPRDKRIPPPSAAANAVATGSS